jgi:uncharacterized iron-regulated protein
MLGIGNAPGGVKASLVAPALTMLLACGAAQEGAGGEVRERIEDLEEGREVSFARMMTDLSSVRVVYVGEEHDDPVHHSAQLEILEALHDHDPSLALGVEMVQRPFQSALDAWVAGEGDEAALLEGIEWEERWGFDFALYRPLFDACRQRHIPMVALNAEKELTRAVARNGLDALDDEERARLPELDLSVSAHRDMIREALSGHPHMTPDFFERMYAAQVVWDETMAERVASVLESPEAPQRMMVIAGSFHVRGGLGIPERAARRGATPYRIVSPVSPDDDPDQTPSSEDSPPSRYRWVLSGRHRTP